MYATTNPATGKLVEEYPTLTDEAARAAIAAHHRTCHLCEAMCGLVIETREGRIEKIRGDEADPLSRGHICPKAVALQDLHEDPDWLRRPLRRRGNDPKPRVASTLGTL